MLLSIRNLSKSFPGTRALDDVVILPSRGHLSDAEGLAFAQAPPQRRVVFLNLEHSFP